MRIVRRLHIAALAVVMAGVCVLTLSDTLVDPATARISVLFDAARMLVEGVGRQTAGIDVLSRSAIPFRTDTIGHFVAWTGVGFVAAGIPATAMSRLNLYFGLFALSAFLEAGQRYLSWSRMAEFSDLVANGLGLAAGFLAFTLVENVVISRLGDLGPSNRAALRRTW